MRDAVLEEAAALFAGAKDEADARRIAEESLPQLQACVERTLKEEGSSLSARVYLTEMYFDTTCYEDFTLPAGVYDALRVELGAHAGRNWFACSTRPVPARRRRGWRCIPPRPGKIWWKRPGWRCALPPWNGWSTSPAKRGTERGAPFPAPGHTMGARRDAIYGNH